MYTTSSFFNITFLAIYKGVKHRLEQFCYMITKSDELLIPIDNVFGKGRAGLNNVSSKNLTMFNFSLVRVNVTQLLTTMPFERFLLAVLILCAMNNN